MKCLYRLDFSLLLTKLILNKKRTFHEKYPDLVDNPMGHFFIKVGDELYFCLVTKKHVANLHQMNKDGLLSEDNKKLVVDRLVKFVLDSKYVSHGDLKEHLKFSVIRSLI